MRLYSEFIAEMEEAGFLEESLWRMGDSAPPDKPRRRQWERALAPASCEFLCHLFDLREFKRILEIGRAAGHTLGLFRWLAPSATIVSVEIRPQPIAEYIARHGDPDLARTFLIDKASDAAFADGDMQEYAPYDLILIDGDHRRPQVRLDWQYAQRVIQPTGVVLFDDVQFGGPAGVFGKIKHRKSLLHSHSRVPGGNRGRMGVVFMGKRPTGLRAAARPALTAWKRPPRKVRRVKRRAEKPVPVDYDRDIALCCVGDGLGNVIEQTCMIQAVQRMYTIVDVWMPRSEPACLDALAGMPGVRYVWRERQPHPPGKSQCTYDAVFHSFLVNEQFLKLLRFTHRFPMRHPTSSGDASEAELATRAARIAGYQGDTPRPYCGWDPYPGEPLRRPLLGLSTGGNPRPVWRWKRYERWDEVVDYLHEKLPELNMVLLGTEEDDQIDRDFVIDFRGKTSFREAAGVIRGCDVFLANDNGLSHTAAALGVRTFALFGPTLIGKNAAQYNTVPIYHRTIGCRPCQFSPQRLGHRFQGEKKVRCEKECLSELKPVMIGNHVLRYLGHEQLCDLRDGAEWYPVLGYHDESIQEMDGSA